VPSDALFSQIRKGRSVQSTAAFGNAIGGVLPTQTEAIWGAPILFVLGLSTLPVVINRHHRSGPNHIVAIATGNHLSTLAALLDNTK